MIDILEKNLLILASAGSGKTYQLGNRVIGLVGEKGVNPESIVALTFTRKAAGEFADSVLTKLGKAVLDVEEAAKLNEQIGGKVNARDVLEQVVHALPRLQLGTMDGFFARIVRGFQYELGLTGGKFELIQGPKLDAALSDILTDILGNVLKAGDAEQFLHAFKRATIGREERGVSEPLSRFFSRWHHILKEGKLGDAWPSSFPTCEVGEWEKNRGDLIDKLRQTVEHDKLIELLNVLELHSIGSGYVSDKGKVAFDRMMEALPGDAPIEVVINRKKIAFSAMESEYWRILLNLLVTCELAAAMERTHAVIELVGSYDDECERRLRRRGLLGFDDVKVLMGGWTQSEEKRLSREAVDFRLDARYHHWLLDEFQDTSQAEWRGILPLIEEAVSDSEASFFVVGDKKQAIYGWRGGDVSLFDSIRKRWSEMGVEQMPKSWRSSPEVLSLVNQVCGDLDAIGRLFGAKVAEQWEWEDHEAARDKLKGESHVEVVDGKAEDRYERMVEKMHHIGVGEREMSCGVLVRTNAQLQTVAEYLRSEGFDVIEEGSRKPTLDNPVGISLSQLLAWLADPADDYARGVIKMSALEEVLADRYEADWQRWEGLLNDVETLGFAGMLESVIEPVWEKLSDFGKRRAGDVIGALAAFDSSGGVSARDALRWIEDLQIAQSPGTAAVQVMTIHKSKGLGFDVVFLPEVDDDQVPNAGSFTVAQGNGWVLQNPAKWVRDQVPDLAAVEEVWGEAQRYEAICVLYVALTRAKQGLYVFLSKCPKNRKNPEDWVSQTNLIKSSINGDDGGIVWQLGDADWYADKGARHEKVISKPLQLQPGVQMVKRTSPSADKKFNEGSGAEGGREYGNEIHAIFEQVGWLDEEKVEFPDANAGRHVAALLEQPEVRRHFEKADRDIQFYREQRVEAMADGKWLSGVIDRLHVYDGGEKVEIIDFKSDAVGSVDELKERYAGQMEAYRGVIKEVYPSADVLCMLLSTKLGEWVKV